MVQLKSGDWSEIYYALETKLHLLRNGAFGTETEPRQDEKWIAHLSTIMRKIGPDGAIAAGCGVGAAAKVLSSRRKSRLG